MKKILLTLVLIVACAAGTVFAQPRHHGYYGRHYGGPHHGYVHYGPAPYYHGSIGSFILVRSSLVQQSAQLSTMPSQRRLPARW